MKSKHLEYYNYVSGDVLNITDKSPVNFIDDIKLDYIKPHLPDNGIILDVGAGSGRLLTRIGLQNPNNYFLVGLDNLISSTYITQKNQHVHKLTGSSILGDALYIPIASNSVDFICSGGLLEHFKYDELIHVLSEMVRVLKLGGVFYSDIVPSKRSLCRPIIRNRAWGYESNISMKEWKSLLEQSGLTEISIFSGLVIPPDFYRFWIPAKRINYIYKCRNFIKSLDNTVISSILGFAYFVFAKKGGAV